MTTWCANRAGVTFLAAIIGLLLTPCVTLAEDDDDDILARIAAEREKQSQQTAELFDEIHLARGQARKLIPLAEEAAGLYLEAFEQQAQLLPQMVETFSRFAEEDRLNQGFTPELERTTSRLNQQSKRIHENLAEQLTAIEADALKVLTRQQRERVSTSDREARPERERSRRDARPLRGFQRNGNDSGQRLHAAREELRELRRKRHKQAGPIGRLLLHPRASERLCEVARVDPSTILCEAFETYTRGTSESPLDAIEQQMAQVAELRAEINNWNLINGLHLSGNQVSAIVSLYDKTQEAPKREYSLRNRRERDTRRATFELERQLRQVLNSGQQQVVAEYNPCLVPPKKLKNPVLVGQASDDSRYEKWLDRARKVSPTRLTQHIETALDTEAERFGKLDSAERKQRLALLRKTVRAAARMDEVDYELSKAELAGRIAPPDRKQELRDEIGALARQHGHPGDVAQFMLTPQFIDQLRVRGQQLAEGIETTPVDLAKGPQAENCDESCAIDGKRSKSDETSAVK